MKTDKKTLWIDYVPTVITAGLIIIFAVIREQSFIKTLPTLVTLIVQLLLVRANRSAFLLGGANSLLYGVSFFCESLYFSAFNAVAINAPIQFFSYFNWKKKSVEGKPRIRTLAMPVRVKLICAISVAWVLCFRFLGPLISRGRFIVADSLVFIIGVVVPILSALGFVDSQYLNIVACTVSLGMWTTITVEEPQNINFALIAAYNLFRVSEAAVTWTRMCKKCTPKKLDCIKGEDYEKKSLF